MDDSPPSLGDKIEQLKGPIFIFGASGFKGANLLQTILKYRSDCYGISHETKVAWRLKLLNPHPENIVYCDILFKDAVKQIFEEYKPQTVFNLVAYGAYLPQEVSNNIYDTNIIGALNILEACGHIHAYVHAGNSLEYGLNSEAPEEAAELVPNSHYSVAKISADYLLKYYAKIRHLPCVNLRLYSAYGPWKDPDRLVPSLLENAKQGKLPFLNYPDFKRDFIYIADCVTAFVNAAYYMNPALYGESINIGTGKMTTIRELVEKVMEIFHLNIRPEWSATIEQKWEIKTQFSNNQKAKKLIRWEPETSLEEGLRETSKWQDEQNYEWVVLPAFRQPQKINKISCVIACYKDGQAIPIMYERLKKVFAELKIPYEIIFVNDSSPDNTEEVIHSICAKDPAVIGVTHSRNFGSQSAFISGMEISTGEGVVLMDGDLQDPPELIPQFYAKWMEGNDVVYGNRTKREASQIMNLSYKLFYKIFSRMAYIRIPRDAGDFSLMDRKVVNELIKLPEKEQFLRGLRAWVGFRQVGVDYVRPERMFGTTTNSLRKNIWWAKKAIFSFSFAPLETISYMGFILTCISFLAIVVQIVLKILHPDIPHGIATVIVLILFFGGIQLLAISVLGEYLSKVFEETKGRPKFIRKSIIYRGKKLDTPAEIKNLLNSIK